MKGYTPESERDQDPAYLLVAIAVAGIFILAGGLAVHGMWLAHHGDGKCTPVTVDDESAIIGE